MTVIEFDEIDNYDDLERLCRDYDIEDEMEDYYTLEQYERAMLEDIYSYYQDDDLRAIQNLCENLQGTGYDRYQYYNGDYYATDDGDDTFTELKDKIRTIFEDNDWFDEEEDDEDDYEEYTYESSENDEPETIPSEPADMIDIADVMESLPDIVLTPAPTEQDVELNEVVEDDIAFEIFDAALNHRELNVEANDESSEERNENISELIGGI